MELSKRDKIFSLERKFIMLLGKRKGITYLRFNREDRFKVYEHINLNKIDVLFELNTLIIKNSDDVEKVINCLNEIGCKYEILNGEESSTIKYMRNLAEHYQRYKYFYNSSQYNNKYDKYNELLNIFHQLFLLDDATKENFIRNDLDRIDKDFLCSLISCDVRTYYLLNRFDILYTDLDKYKGMDYSLITDIDKELFIALFVRIHAITNTYQDVFKHDVFLEEALVLKTFEKYENLSFAKEMFADFLISSCKECSISGFPKKWLK